MYLYCQISVRKIFFVIIFLGLISVPLSTFSDASNCSVDGATVIFVNGIFTAEPEARNSLTGLQDQFSTITKRKDVKFILGYNSTHLGGLGDMLKAVVQGYNGASLDYDLATLLSQVHGQLQTRKVLLVGHSQGTFYTNAAYDYLIGHGAAKESIGVYNVATPADKVAGGGTYLTSSTDKMISSVVAELAKIGNARRPLEPNIGLALSAEEQAKPLGGHGFSGVYLAEAPERIIGDIQQALTLLSSSEAPSVSGGCFIAPKSTLAHKLTGLGFYVLDTATPAVTTTVASLYVTAKTTMAAAYRTVANSVQYALAHPEVLIAGLNSSAGQQAAVPG